MSNSPICQPTQRAAWRVSCQSCGWSRDAATYAVAGQAGRDHGASCPDASTAVEPGAAIPAHARGCTFDANGVELTPCPYCDGVNAPMCPPWCQVGQDEHGRQLVTSEGVYVHTCRTSPDGAPYLVQVTRVQRVALCHGSPALLGFDPAGVYVDGPADDVSAEDASDMAAALVRAAAMAMATRDDGVRQNHPIVGALGVEGVERCRILRCTSTATHRATWAKASPIDPRPFSVDYCEPHAMASQADRVEPLASLLNIRKADVDAATDCPPWCDNHMAGDGLNPAYHNNGRFRVPIKRDDVEGVGR